MKILLVNHTFPPDSWAGSEICVLNTALELRRWGHDTAVFYRISDPSRDEYFLREGEFQGIPIYAINHTYRLVRSFQDIYINPAIAARFGYVLRQFQPDIVHFHHLTNLSLSLVREAKACGCATVMTLHDYWLLCQRGQLLKRDLRLCSGPSVEGCRSCLSMQLLRGRAQRVVSRLLSRGNPGASFGNRIDLRKIQHAHIDTPDRRFVQLTHFAMGDQPEETLQAHPPCSITYDFSVPGPAVLQTAIGLHPSTYTQEGGGVIFEIEWNGKPVFSQCLNPKIHPEEKEWHPVRIELPEGPEAGSRLVLRTRSELEGDNCFCTAGWWKPSLDVQTAAEPVPVHYDERKMEIRQRIYQAAEVIADAVAAFSPRAMEGILHRRNWVRRVWDGMDLFLSPSRFLRDYFIQNGLPEEKIVYLDNGFLPIPAPVAKPIQKPLRFGYIGTWIPSKGVDLALRAFQSIDPQEARLAVYGFFPGYDGFENYEDYLRSLAGPAVEWGGKYQPDEVYSLLSQMDCVIMPSIWWENSPLTLHEAFQAGVPVIAADAGGMRESLRGGGGLLFQLRDSESLQSVIRRIIRDPNILVGLRRTIPGIQSLDEHVACLLTQYEKVQSKDHGDSR